MMLYVLINSITFSKSMIDNVWNNTEQNKENMSEYLIPIYIRLNHPDYLKYSLVTCQINHRNVF